MNRHHVWAALALALPLTLAGCGSTAAPGASGALGASTSTSGPAAGSVHTPGMVMPDGSTMGPMDSGSSATSAATVDPAGDAEPSATSKMVCEDEIQGVVKQLVGLTTTPTTASTWKDSLFTCTYTLPGGTTVLSVKQSADPTAARAYFDGLQAGATGAESLDGLQGLGLPSFRTPAGTVAFVKDSMTLLVDATRMPATIGPQDTARGSYAFTIASNVLACWKEHDSGS